MVVDHSHFSVRLRRPQASMVLISDQTVLTCSGGVAMVMCIADEERRLGDWLSSWAHKDAHAVCAPGLTSRFSG